MASLTNWFERLIEKFLTGDLDRRALILSWIILFILILGIAGTVQVLRSDIPVKDPVSGVEKTVPVKDLLLKSGY